MAASVGLQPATHPLPSILSFQEMIPQDFRTRAYRTEVLRERVRGEEGTSPLTLWVFPSGTWRFGGMSSKVARGEECEAQQVPRAAQLLTVRAGRIARWEESTGSSTHDSAAPDVYPSPPKLLQLFLPHITR